MKTNEEIVKDVFERYTAEIRTAAVRLTYARIQAVAEAESARYVAEGRAADVVVRFPGEAELGALTGLAASMILAEQHRMRGIAFDLLADKKDKTTKTEVYDMLYKEMFPDIELRSRP